VRIPLMPGHHVGEEPQEGAAVVVVDEDQLAGYPRVPSRDKCRLVDRCVGAVARKQTRLDSPAGHLRARHLTESRESCPKEHDRRSHDPGTVPD
jgi:hypothetical protein